MFKQEASWRSPDGRLFLVYTIHEPTAARMNTRPKTHAEDDTAAVDYDHNAEILRGIFEFAPDATLLINMDGCIVKANEQTGKMFGFPRGEMLGQPVELLIPERYANRHIGYRSGYTDCPRTRPMGAGVELFGRRKDQTEFPVDIMLSPLHTDSGHLILAVVRDITERRRMEQQAHEARETFLREVHHRVKNNLQVISSLLFLQSTYFSDGPILESLRESQNRIRSIALIHERLYRSTEMVRVDFSEYVRDLVNNLCSSYAADALPRSVETNVSNVGLEVDTAIPCGLIINELVTNALKHAFPGRRSGHIFVGLAEVASKRYVLTVKDDGVGFAPGFDWRSSNSLGLKLVSDLTRQLEGSLHLDATEGTTFQVDFKELHYKDRS